MKSSALTFVNLTIAAILLLTPFLVGSTASTPYNPWYDLDENGAINIFDVVRIAGTYGTTGDPGKNVNVTNWPTSETQIVWWNHPVEPYQASYSAYYNASGFGQLHLAIHCLGLTGTERVAVYVYGVIHNPAYPSSDLMAVAQLIWLEPSSLVGGENCPAISMPVPGEQFAFCVVGGEGTYGAMFMSFYLTWS